MNLTETEMESLKATKNSREWNDACDAIKRARGGEYPQDWFARVLATGLMKSITESWKR